MMMVITSAMDMVESRWWARFEGLDLYSSVYFLLSYRNNCDFSFEMMDSQFVEGFESYLRQRGAVRNTTSFYLRCVRSVYNRAADRGLTTNQHPFKHVYTSNDKTVKRALCIEDIKAVKRLNLSYRPALDFARDMFLFSLFTRGMSFVDMAYLRKSDLQDGSLTYRRKKTGQLLNIEWMPCMQRIVNKHRNKNTQYLLPIIADKNIDERRQYQNRMRCINRNLKKVAEMAHIQVSLSSYFARHSWATLARNLNVPLAIISAAMGHDSEATTQIYLGDIQSSVVDSVNRSILGYI